jgi:hypothetical protein
MGQCFALCPLHEINQPSAHDLVDRGDRTGLNHGDERAPLFAVERGGRPVDLPSTRPSGPWALNRSTQIAKHLQADPAEPSRVRPRAAFIDRDQREKASSNAADFLRKRLRELYEDVYCALGDIENRIKEPQAELFADRTSTGTMLANQLRLWFSSFAYVLVVRLR